MRYLIGVQGVSAILGKLISILILLFQNFFALPAVISLQYLSNKK